MPRRRRHDKRRHTYTDDNEMELLVGPELATILAGEPDSDSTFPSEDARREAWEERGESLVIDIARKCPGERPWAWWSYEADREDFAFLYAGDERQVERMRFLVASGTLTDSELEALRADVAAARARIGTQAQEGELLADGTWLGGDRTKAAVGDVLDEADE